jgi:hypothetical protein
VETWQILQARLVRWDTPASLQLFRSNLTGHGWLVGANVNTEVDEPLFCQLLVVSGCGTGFQPVRLVTDFGPARMPVAGSFNRLEAGCTMTGRMRVPHSLTGKDAGPTQIDW